EGLRRVQAFGRRHQRFGAHTESPGPVRRRVRTRIATPGPSLLVAWDEHGVVRPIHGRGRCCAPTWAGACRVQPVSKGETHEIRWKHGFGGARGTDLDAGQHWLGRRQEGCATRLGSSKAYR